MHVWVSGNFRVSGKLSATHSGYNTRSIRRIVWSVTSEVNQGVISKDHIIYGVKIREQSGG